MPADPWAMDELSDDECWELLRLFRIARLAMCLDGHPSSSPSTSSSTAGRSCSAPPEGTKLSAARNCHVAFEVDDYDATSGLATSVIVTGRETEITEPDEWESARDVPLFPWHVGPTGHFVRISPDDVSGRRFRAAYADPDGARTSPAS